MHMLGYNNPQRNMEFQGSAHPLDPDGLKNVCASLDIDAPRIWAVLSVETLGFGFLEDRRPQILFERHIFHRQTDGAFDATNPNVSNPSPGGYSHGASEYARLAEAMKCDHAAALKSCSWGIGQIMGFNFQSAGFDNVGDMVSAMVASETSQLKAVGSFIRNNGMAEALRSSDWATFASKYNGPDYAINNYDVRLKAAEAKARVLSPDLRYRSGQACLRFLNFNPGPIDGLPGRKTRAAISAYQTGKNMPSTGELDDATYAGLQTDVFG